MNDENTNAFILEMEALMMVVVVVVVVVVVDNDHLRPYYHHSVAFANLQASNEATGCPNKIGVQDRTGRHSYMGGTI